MSVVHAKDTGDTCVYCGGPALWTFDERREKTFWFRQCLDCGAQFKDFKDSMKRTLFKVIPGGLSDA